MGKARQKQVNKPDQPSRAAQIAATVEDKLKALGQFTAVKAAKPMVVESETPQIQQRRRELSRKLQSFWE